ncbi:MAG: M56 family metallopeptidase [Hyphomonadaceae bacterium]|nr:M56 family metallopeptidase [Hyphomonadaceae bacterium]
MISLAWLVVSSLVWGAALFAVGWLLQRSSDLSGRARQWIWRGCAFLLVAPWIAAPLVSGFGLGMAPRIAPVIGAVASFEATSIDVAPVFLPVSDAAAVTPAPSQAFALPDIDWEGTLLALLIVGWLVRFVMAQFAARRLGGVVANSRPVEAGVAMDALDAWSARLGLKRKPDLRLIAANVSPFSYGVVRPVICLPEGLDEKLGREPLQLVVAHECLHVARGDGWLRPIERMVADIFWFNPFAWAVRRELDMARELACDEGVVELSSARHAYARTLRDVAGLSAGLSPSAPAASMSLAGGGRVVMLRVKRTLALAKRKPARAALVAAAVLGLVGAPIAVGQVVLTTPRPPAAPEAPEAPEVLAPAEPVEVAEAPQAPEAPPAPVAPVDEPASVAEPSPAAEATPEPRVAPLPPTPQAAPSVGVAPTPPSTPRAMPAPQQAPAPPEARSIEQADRKTELVALGGKSVDRIQLRYDFDGEWLIDTQNILYRDDARDYYLVTLKEACEQLEIRSLRFRFYPSWSWQLRADRTYDVRPEAGAHCDVAKIEQVDRARADALRAASLRRIW